MEVEIEPHDTRVLHIHPLLGRPQLIGISRHISGAYSVLDLKWDAAQSILQRLFPDRPGRCLHDLRSRAGRSGRGQSGSVGGVRAVPALGSLRAIAS